MIINHNMQALNAHRQMGTNATNAQKSMEKLSSGLRINRAGDDAAGLAISEKMRGQIRGLDQASRNAQDGISLIQTAEGALNETHSILQRMRELSVQAANDTNTTDDRAEIQKEINQLTSEINRIGNNTEFNTQNLLKGGETTGKVTVANTQGSEATTQPPTSGTSTAQNQANLNADVTGLTGAKLSVVIGSDTFELSNADILALKDKSETEAADYIADKAVTTGSKKLSAVANVKFEGGKLTIETNATGTGQSVQMTLTPGTAGGGGKTAEDLLGVGTAVKVDGKDATPVAAKQGTATVNITTNFAAGDKIEVNGKVYTAIANGETAKEGEFAIGADTDATAQALLDAIKAADNTVDTTSSVTGSKITLKQATATNDATPFKVNTKADYSLTLQIGANKDQTINVSIGDMRAQALGISGTLGGDTSVAGASFVAVAEGNELSDKSGVGQEYALDISSNAKATAATEVLDKAMKNVSSERSKLGAYQNRLEHTINNLGTSSENLTAAESRVRDVDMAKEMMTMSKNNILQQAAQAMLAQANQVPQQVLQLLR